MHPLIKIPFLRIILPLLVGILIGIRGWAISISWIWLAPLLLIALLTGILSSKFPRIITVTLLTCDLFLFLLGLINVQVSDISRHVNYYGKVIHPDSTTYYLGTIQELPIEKEKFIKCAVKLQSVKKHNHYVSVVGNLIVYIRKSLSFRRYKAGQNLLFKAQLQEVVPPKNPEEFNYKAYLGFKHIYHTAFIDSNNCTVVNVGTRMNPLLSAGLTIKSGLLNCFQESALNRDARAICSALLTGYDEEVDKPVMEAFSHSGTLHVLSVSGLHTGLIYLTLNFFFNIIDPHKRYKFGRFLFIAMALWLFALVTGFSSPVLRAVIMFNLFGFGKIYFRNNARNQINILLVSAFVLLFYNPYYLMDVGFVLSYTALIGMMYFQPRIAVLWQPRTSLFRQTWLSITASIGATLGTLPVTLFYFKQFPLWFFISNLLVVPLSFILLLLAFLLALQFGFFTPVINYLVKFMLAFMKLFNTEGVGYVDAIDFTATDAVYLCLLLIFVSVAVETRRYKAVLASLSVLIFWQASALKASYRQKTISQLCVFHINKHQSVSVKNKTQVHILCDSSANYNYHVKPLLTSYNNPKIIKQGFDYVQSLHQNLLIVSQNKMLPVKQLRETQTLLISNNFKLEEDYLERLTALKTVVADGSNNNFIIGHTAKLCRKFGLVFYSTKTKGALILPLP